MQLRDKHQSSWPQNAMCLGKDRTHNGDMLQNQVGDDDIRVDVGYEPRLGDVVFNETNLSMLCPLASSCQHGRRVV